jgi:hypothetical protein
MEFNCSTAFDPWTLVAAASRLNDLRTLVVILFAQLCYALMH